VIPLRDAAPPRRTAIVTLVLIALCVAGFGLELTVEALGGDTALNQLIEQWGFIPADAVAAVQGGNILSEPVLDVFSAMFLHAGWVHLLGNLLFLWIFGPNLEGRIGGLAFLALYLLGGAAAAAVYTLADPTSTEPMIGASGAISAVLGAYLVLFPRARIQSLVFLGFFYQLIAVPAVLVLGFWFVLQVIDGVAALGATTEMVGGVAFWAHIGGFVAGMAMALPWRLRSRRA
jgi:membrane associated rhomboid family serine protease